MTKLHFAKRGQKAGKLVACKAEERACPVGGGHYSDEYITAVTSYLNSDNTNSYTRDSLTREMMQKIQETVPKELISAFMKLNTTTNPVEQIRTGNGMILPKNGYYLPEQAERQLTEDYQLEFGDLEPYRKLKRSEWHSTCAKKFTETRKSLLEQGEYESLRDKNVHHYFKKIERTIVEEVNRWISSRERAEAAEATFQADLAYAKTDESKEANHRKWKNLLNKEEFEDAWNSYQEAYPNGGCPQISRHSDHDPESVSIRVNPFVAEVYDEKQPLISCYHCYVEVSWDI